MTTPDRQRSPATLASRLQKVMAKAAAQLPLLSDLGGGVHEQASWQPGGLEAGLYALHESITALDTATHPAAQPATDLDERALLVRSCAERVGAEAEAFRQRSELAATRLQPVLQDFLLEFRALEKGVDRCDQWLEEMCGVIAGQQAKATAEVSVQALATLADRADDLRSRLALLQAVDRSARNVHALADSLALTRPKLLDTVQGKLVPACALLGQRLALFIEEGSRPAAAALSAARSDAQIWTAQAMSLALRLQAANDRLVREAAALRHRCSLLPQPEQDVDRPAPCEEAVLAEPDTLQPLDPGLLYEWPNAR